MVVRTANPKRLQYISVTLIYGLGLLCALHFAWTAILDPWDLLHEQKGRVAFSYGQPLPFFRLQYKPFYRTIIRSSAVQPEYRESLAKGMKVDGLFRASVQLETVLGLSKQAEQPPIYFARSDFVIGVVIPCGFILFTLIMQYWAIGKGRFSWWETVVCVAIVAILLAILMPVAIRPRHYGNYTRYTWKALTLPSDATVATVLDQVSGKANGQQVIFVLYRMATVTKETLIYSSNGTRQFAEGGDYVVAAIADGKKYARSLVVTSIVLPRPSSRGTANTSKLEILRRVTNAKDDSIFLTPGAGLPKLRYDFRKFTFTTIEK